MKPALWYIAIGVVGVILIVLSGMAIAAGVAAGVLCSQGKVEVG